MSVHRIVLTAIAAVALVAVAPEANGGGGTPITSCGQVVTTNAFLTQDLTCPGSAGIVVGASGITIDLKGFDLVGDRSGHHGIDDTAGHGAVTVKNGVVRNFTFGVIGLGDKISVSNLVAAGNLSDGIFLTGNAAKIQSSTASGNGFRGIGVGGDSALIHRSTVSGNASHGIGVGGNSAKIQSVTASGNGGTGIVVSGLAASIQRSAASGNGSNGILADGDAAKVNGNRTEGNGFPDGASDNAGLGIATSGYTTAPVGKNVARGNDDPAECSPALLC
jgi:hypothetical protein